MPSVLDVGPIFTDLIETLAKPAAFVVVFYAAKVAVNAALDLIAVDSASDTKGKVGDWARSRRADWRKNGPLR